MSRDILETNVNTSNAHSPYSLNPQRDYSCILSTSSWKMRAKDRYFVVFFCDCLLFPDWISVTNKHRKQSLPPSGRVSSVEYAYVVKRSTQTILAAPSFLHSAY